MSTQRKDEDRMMSDSEFRVIADSNNIPGVSIEKDGVHFGCYAAGKEPPTLILYRKGTEEIAARLPFPKSDAAGGLYTMKVRLQPADYEYNFEDGGEICTDPWARLVVGREEFGRRPEDSPHNMRGAFPAGTYDWGGDRLPQLPYDETIMYHLHVRGFTKQKNSGTRKKGTFAGLRDKIPYLKQLGVNQVRLMPVYEFAEMVPRFPKEKHAGAASGRIDSGNASGPGLQADQKSEIRIDPGVDPQSASASMTKNAAVAGSGTQVAEAMKSLEQYRMNYWGYGEDAFYFAPKAAYAATKSPDVEFKDMVKAFHEEGMEVILEFSFPDEIDFSRIAQCLSYWATEYHVDGFAVMTRDSAVAELARLPLFRSRKLICTWYPDELKRNKGRLLAEANDSFMNDCRRVLKGDEQFLRAFSYQLRCNPVGCGRVNYITNHDGFTLMDLVSYDRKYNMDNGEYNRDGSDFNYSWNCGEEGPSRKREIRALRMRQRKNAFAMLLFSQGTPMLLAGDEFGNSQNGNNNPYCHDNELSWTDWSAARSNKELSDFVQKAIAYRKAHKALHQENELQCMDYRSLGYPDLSFHGERAWYGDFEQMGRGLGCLYCGEYAGEDDFLYIAYNFNWIAQEFALPILPKGMSWRVAMNTSQKDSFIPAEEQEALEDTKAFQVPARTVMVLEGRK